MAVANWCATTLAPAEWPEFAGLALHARERAALRREPAPAGRALHRPGRAGRPRAGRAAARQGDVLQQLRRRGRRLAQRERLHRAVRGDHQARQPVRHRDRRGRGRRAPQGARLRPGVGVRRGDRGQPGGHRRAGQAGRGDLHRGDRGAVLRGRGGRGAAREEEPAGARGAGVEPAAGRVPAGRRRRAGADGGPDRRRRATTRRTGPWPPATPRRPGSSPTWRSPGGRSAA